MDTMNTQAQEESRRYFAALLPGRVSGTYIDLHGEKKPVNGVVTRWSERRLGESHSYTKYGRSCTTLETCEVLMIDGEVHVGHFNGVRVTKL